jgi:hypothetical protein
MDVFICWSGDRSKAIAQALTVLVRQVLSPPPEIFLSENIDKGAEWFQAVRAGLDSARAGIIVLTHENIHSPWMHFEAGALARTLEADPVNELEVVGAGGAVTAAGAHPSAVNPALLAGAVTAAHPRKTPARRAVFPLLHGVSASAMTGPLAAYQSTTTTRADIGRLLSALAGILECSPLAHDDQEPLIPAGHWSAFEGALEAATAPLAKVVPGFATLFQRKTFEEAFHQCTSQDWLARYEVARTTHRRLDEHRDLVKAACSPHEQGLFQMLLADLDVYAMAIEALLITRRDFSLDDNGELRMDSGTRTCCENQRLAIKSVSMRLVHPLDAPLTTAAVRFMAAATPEERRAIVHRIEGRIRWHREVAYEATAKAGRAEAARAAIAGLMNETTGNGGIDSQAPPPSAPELPLRCAVPDRLMIFRASTWDLDRIFYYRVVYYFETAAFRWPAAALPEPPGKTGLESVLAAPMEHDLFCAARDVEMECERYRARTKGGSLMPLICALDALQGLHPRNHPTPAVDRAMASAIGVVNAELNVLPPSDERDDIRRLLAKLS